MPFITLLSLSSLRDKTHYTSPINIEQNSFFRSHKMNSTIFSRFLRVLLRSFCHHSVVILSETYGKWFDFPCHYTNSNPHDVLRAIKVLKEDKKYMLLVLSSPIKRAELQNMKRANTISTITVELTIKVETKLTSFNAEKTNGFISPQMLEIFTRAACTL